MALLLTALCLPCIPALAEDNAREVFTAGDFYYALLEDGTAEIIGYRIKSLHELVIPPELDGRRVTAIGERAFDDQISLESVILPDTITAIGANAFAGCKLTEITIPDSVITMDANPFGYCQGLTRFIVSEDHPALAAIGGVLFGKADARLIAFPGGLPETAYTVPEGTRIIGDYAFYGCKSLNGINMPGSVAAIGSSAFRYCSSLASINLPDSVAVIGNNAFNGCASLESIVIPESVTTIGDGAFGFCRGLTEFTIPDSVTSIGANPFSYCSSLARLNVSPDHPALAIIDGVLFSKDGERLITYPCALTNPSYSIPQGTRIIGDSAFSYCWNLTDIAIPDGA